jgi:AraC-like DNA-binding protein
MSRDFTFKSLIAVSAAFVILVSMGRFSPGEAKPEGPSVSSLDAPFSLAGEWKIAIGDDANYAAPGFNDAEWDTVNLPGNLMTRVIAKTTGLARTEGVVWLRKTIRIDRNLPKEDLGLVLGRIGNADETYFNGTRIGAMGEFEPDAHSMWNHPRYYTISRDFVRYGADNVIAVRVSYYVFGEVLGELAITNMKDWRARRDMGKFLIIDLCYFVIGMGLTLLFITAFFFIRRPSSQEYLFYCLQLLCGLIMVMELCTYWNPYGSLLNRFKILAFGWAAVNVVYPIFLHRIYDLKRKKIEIALWIYVALVTFIALFFVDTAGLRVNGIIMIIVTFLIGPYNISCHVSALRRKHPYAKPFSFFGIVIVIAALHDGVLYLMKFIGADLNMFGSWFQFMIFQYAAAGLYVGTALVLVVRFAKIMDDIEDLNTSLENFVIENALLNERLSERNESRKRGPYPVISDMAEEKIQKVINYIHENYTFDISREGLAATVDVHPDSLGKLFKSVTSKKLGEYINELRVKDAAKKLVETDDNVINIAFSVGFDSLRTFNRVFPKFMNMTPEKYRKEFKK